MAITLNATTDSIDVVTTAAVNTDYVASFVDEDGTTFTPGDSDGQITTATTTTIVSAPAASTRRGLKNLSITNVGTVANTCTVRKAITGPAQRQLFRATLLAMESIQYTDSAGWVVVDATGRKKVAPYEELGYNGWSSPFFKNGTGSDATGYWYCTSKDAGFPGAFTPGTPGLAGRNVDGTSEPGVQPLANPASGSNYLTGLSLASNAVHAQKFFDLLWINSGLVVTLVTAQTINSAAFPARDVNGSAGGVGLMIGMLVTTVLTNVGTISGITVSYTNELGTAGRTATLSALVGSQLPASAVVGTIIWFNLAAGDKGVRSIETLTFGTSLVTGAVSLIVARDLVASSNSTVNVTTSAPLSGRGVRLYNGTAILHNYQSSATTGTVHIGQLMFREI